MAKPTSTLKIEMLQNENNLLFLTLIEHKKQRYLTVIENIVGNEIQAYVLDNLDAEGIDQDWFMSVATKWFYAASERYPLSFEFTKLGRPDVPQKILKTFSILATGRMIGKPFSYPLGKRAKVKRRKVTLTPEPLPGINLQKPAQ